MTNYSQLIFQIKPMTPVHVSEVMKIEEVAFSAPWSERAYDYELRYNEMARYFIAYPNPAMRLNTTMHTSWWQRLLGAETSGVAETSEPIVGYGGFWLMVDEAHISTIASHPNWRGQGVGELLLVAMIDNAAELGAQSATLEVRASNVVAQSLYFKYAFDVVGVRKRYYSDNGEDALIMTTPSLTSAEYQGKFQKLKSALLSRLSP